MEGEEVVGRISKRCVTQAVQDDTEDVFINSADRQGADRGCEGDRDVVHVRVAVPHDRDRDALPCITIEGLQTCLDQARYTYIYVCVKNCVLWIYHLEKFCFF